MRLSLIYQNPCKDKRDDISYVLDFEKRKERVTKPMKDDRFDSGIDIRHEVLTTKKTVFAHSYFLRGKFTIKPRPVAVDLVFRADIQTFCRLRC